MNHPTMQKLALMAAALLTSFALSAQAGPKLSTARQTNGSSHSINPIHKLLFPDATYEIDDGSAEDAIGLTAGGDTIALNGFPVIPGSENITSVEIAWGTPAFFDPSLDGLPYTVAIWSDPNGDGSPTDAVLLTTASGVVSNQGTDTFITTTINATITTPGFFVGFLITQLAGQFPCAFDETNPTLSNRSFIAGDTTPGTGNITNLNDNELPVAPIEFYGLIGNWLIRANAGTGGGDITLGAEVRRQGGNKIVALSWSPADGGDINVFRNGVNIGTTLDDGQAQDKNPGIGQWDYQVCETDSGDCSNTARVRIRH
jgi:hypothetical protein